MLRGIWRRRGSHSRRWPRCARRLSRFGRARGLILISAGTPDQYSRVREKIAIKSGPAKTEQLAELKNKFTRNPQEIKIPAGFLMDTLLHMKGMRVGDSEISDKQVISIYNRGKATAKDV